MKGNPALKKLSLQEQLLKTGLTNENKVKQVRAEKRKQVKKQQKNKLDTVDEAKLLAQQAKVKQQEKDKQLNQLRQQKDQKKQQLAQIFQLIKGNKVVIDEDTIAYHFSDQSKVKTLYISEAIRQKIISGRLAIVNAQSDYALVSTMIAEKIQALDDRYVVLLLNHTSNTIEDENYQDYPVPDDLIW